MAAAEPERRLETPKRETLLAHYANAEVCSKVILVVESAVGLVALTWVASRPLGPLSWLAFGLGAVGVFRWFLQYIFLNKKRLEDIRPDARFGDHTRESLLRVVNDVFRRFGLKRQAAPVFLTGTKDVNAHALRCELWPGWHLFNGVFLNRSIIHLLDERELASVVGHELGHVFPYAPLLSRCYAVHALFAGLVSMAAAAAYPLPGVALVVPFAVLWLLDLAISFPHHRLSRAIEFLCDDYGAQAAGLLPALSGELKIAAEQETRQRLLLRTLEARRDGTNVSLGDIIEAYDEAVPYGKVDPETFASDFQKLTVQQQRARQGISLGGFLRHLQGSDTAQAHEWAQQEIDKLNLIESLPLLPIDYAPFLQGSQKWSLELAERLATTIENVPTAVLVRAALEIDDRDSTHPSPSRRILFLWRNRSVYPGTT